MNNARELKLAVAIVLTGALAIAGIGWLAVEVLSWAREALAS